MKESIIEKTHRIVEDYLQEIGLEAIKFNHEENYLSYKFHKKGTFFRLNIFFDTFPDKIDFYVFKEHSQISQHTCKNNFRKDALLKKLKILTFEIK